MSNHHDEPSLVLPIVALCSLLVCWPIGLILSVVAVVKTKGYAGSTAKTLSIVALAVHVLLAVPMTGVLAAIAIPNFVKFQCRSKQSEAKVSLKTIYVAEESYRGEHNRYADDLEELGWRPMGARQRYELVVTEATDTSFTAEARGVGEMEGDLWTINQDNQLQAVESLCGGRRQ